MPETAVSENPIVAKRFRPWRVVLKHLQPKFDPTVSPEVLCDGAFDLPIDPLSGVTAYRSAVVRQFVDPMEASGQQRIGVRI